MFNPGGFRLVVRRGPQPNQVYELNKDRITLGRDITNEITINDPECSRHHCRLTRGQGGYTLEDLGSTNGTFVNGRRLTGAHPLNPGDLIGLGETVTLAYEANVGAAQVQAPAAASPFGAAPDPASYSGGTSASPAAPVAPRPELYEQASPTPSAPPAYYAQAQPYFPPQGATTSSPSYYSASQQGARGNRGCGLLIGCGILFLVAIASLIVGIIVVDSPLDNIPLVADGVGAIPLPGSNVDNVEKYLEAMGSCNPDAADYVCSQEQSSIPSTSAETGGACPIKIEDITCKQDGSDVTCTYKVVSGESSEEMEQTFNIRNGKVCGTVFFASGTSE